jgi:hypothetical protein
MAAEDFETFPDHFLSVYQSAIVDIAKQLDAKSSASGSRGRAQIGRSASSLLPGIASDIARREFARTATSHNSPPNSPQRRVLSPSDIGRVCADLAFRYMKARANADVEAVAQIQGEFRASTCDPAWLNTIEQYLRYFGPDGGRREIPYIRASAVGSRTINLKRDARIALVGDWGTGQLPAVEILKHIAAAKPDVLIHLGDIYYSGTPYECQSNFLDLINTVVRSANPDIPVYTLAGNHDMYCGGVGYYDLIKRLNTQPLTQPASFFCLRDAERKWQLLAMDTGLHDYSPFGVSNVVTYIEEDELEWHCARIKEFPGRTILLSHHQLFSAFSTIGTVNESGNRLAINPKLLHVFEKMRTCGSIAAWFWGHEHTLSIYNSFSGLERGRCLGNGAVPVSLLDKIFEPIPNLVSTPTILPGTESKRKGTVYAHGYALLSLKNDTCTAEYYDLPDTRPRLIHSEYLT